MWQDEILSQCFMGLQNWRYIWGKNVVAGYETQKCLNPKSQNTYECILCTENLPMEKACSFLSFNNCQSLLRGSFYTYIIGHLSAQK